MSTLFSDHTIETAPSETVPALKGTLAKFGFVPAAMARLAESPSATEGFLRILAIFERSSLGPVEREVLAMTVGHEVGCEVCVALHSAALSRDPSTLPLVEPLRHQASLADPRLEALRLFTRRAMAGGGHVPELQLQAFLDAGFTTRQALDVVLGIATYTLSTFANRLTGAPLDPPFEVFRWRRDAAAV